MLFYCVYNDAGLAVNPVLRKRMTVGFYFLYGQNGWEHMRSAPAYAKLHMFNQL